MTLAPLADPENRPPHVEHNSAADNTAPCGYRPAFDDTLDAGIVQWLSS